MIYQLISSDKKEYAQAKSQLHLLKEYEREFGEISEIDEIIDISEEESKTIMLTNSEYDEDNPENDMPENISLFDMVCGNDFCIIGSTEWD